MNERAVEGTPRLEWLVLIPLALIHFLSHVLTNGNYGMFRDEFYYLACADHLAWGYVDHPPLSVALLAGWKALFGDSVHSIRILPALAGAALVIMAGVLARELGGRRFAQTLSAVCVMIAPVYLVITGFYSMNPFDLIFWALGYYLIIRIVKTGDGRTWILLGLVLGLGLMNKISVLFLGFGLLVGLLMSPLRSHLRQREIWIGGGIAALLFLPYILWQIPNDWPTLEFMANATRYKISDFSPLEFLTGTALEMNPISLPIWVAGLLWLLIAKSGRPHRILGVIFITVLVVLTVQKSKTYYLASAYPALMGAGACAVEQCFDREWLRWAKPVALVTAAAGGIFIAPFALPLLPPESFLQYQQAIGLEPPRHEVGDTAAMPQYFADRFGWENMAATVARVYNSLPADERSRCAIFCQNYGEAGAVAYYGRRYGLPPAITTHNSFYLWGPGEASGDILIIIGGTVDDYRHVFEEVSRAATIVSPHAMPYETDLAVLVCRGLKRSMEEHWRMLKVYV